MNKNISTLEEMPGALSYLIWKVEGLEETIQTLRNKQQAANSIYIDTLDSDKPIDKEQ